MSATEYIAFLGIVLAASAFQGASGFGFGMTAMSVLPFAVEAKAAVVYVAVLVGPLSAWLLWNLRHHASLKPVLPVVVGSVLVGTPAGIILYAVSDTWVLKQVIGLALSASCGLLWWQAGARPRRLSGWLGFPVGVVSGVLGGICNVGGAPVIVYIWLQPLEKAVANARLQTIFVFSTMARLPMLLAAPGVLGRSGFEAVTAGAVGTALTALPLVALGGWLGLKVFRRVDAAALRRGAYAFVIVVGLVLFGKTRWGEKPRLRPAASSGPVAVRAAAGGDLVPSGRTYP